MYVHVCTATHMYDNIVVCFLCCCDKTLNQNELSERRVRFSLQSLV